MVGEPRTNYSGACATVSVKVGGAGPPLALRVYVCSEAREDAMLQWKRTRLCLLSVEILVTLVSLRILPVAEGQSCSAQPVISSVDPPSGSRQTRFAILGQNLDQPGSITVIQRINDEELDILETTNVTQTRIELTVNPLASSLATITIDPNEEDCGSASVEIYVVFIGMHDHTDSYRSCMKMPCKSQFDLP